MGVIAGKTFKSGTSVALRLPRELGFGPDMVVTIRPAIDPVEDKRELLALIARLEEIWKDVPREERRSDREPIEFPNRPALY